MLYIRDGFLLVLKAKQFLHSRWEEVMCAHLSISITFIYRPFDSFLLQNDRVFLFRNEWKFLRNPAYQQIGGGNRRNKCILEKLLIEQIWLWDIRTKCKDIMKHEKTSPSKWIIRPISYCVLFHGVNLSYDTFYWTATKRLSQLQC